MISVADLKARLNLPPSPDTTYDALLTSLEAEAVRQFELETGRYFGVAQAGYEIVSGSGTPRIWLSNDPTPSTTVTVSYRVSTALDWTAFASGTYEVDGRRLTLFTSILQATGGSLPALDFGASAGLVFADPLSGGWPRGFNNLKVAYTRGYAIPTDKTADDTQTNVPADVREAVFEKVNTEFRNRVTATSDMNPILGRTINDEQPIRIGRIVAGTIALWRIPALVGAGSQMRQFTVTV